MSARSTRILHRLRASQVRGDNTDYLRFIVLTSPRSGSSFLTQSLRSHPGVVAFGEVLGPGNVWFNTPGFPARHRGLKRFRDRDPVRFMDSVVFGGYAAAVRAVGLKVFHSHLEVPRFTPLVEYFRSVPRFRGIRLERRNHLRAYLSEVLRSRTGVAWIESENDRRPLTVELDRTECERYFETRARLTERYDGLFEGCEMLKIDYETLVDEFERTAGSIQRYLDLQPARLSSPTVRQEVRPLEAAIRNYEELRRAFRSTPWVRFFD